MTDYDERLPRRIEAVFARAGMGNTDAEKLEAFAEDYERAMSAADRLRNAKGKNFEEILAVQPEANPENES